MKKLFTLICALVGLTSSVNAAKIDDVKVCKHSYVLVADEWTNNGTVRPGKGNLFGDGFFLDVTGGSVATNKGMSDPNEILTDETGAPTGELRYDAAFAAKYGEYGAHYNSLRLKKAQDVIAMKVTAGSKLIFLIQGNNKSGTSARIPCIATDAKLTKTLNEKPGADFPAVPAGFLYEWTAQDDYTIYIGSYNGDMFVGYIIVEANEAPGTPSVKVGNQTFENGLWYREVTCKPNTYDLMGTILPTVVTYTTDGSTPTADSPKYTEPIKCYKEQTVKFQAFVDSDEDGIYDEECPGAENEGIVSFSFNAPTISVEGGNVTITSEYEGAQNFYKYGEADYTEGSSVTLTESATLTAMSKIVNGSYATFEPAYTSKDVYVLNPISEEKIITVSGTAVVDEEATASSTTGTIYKIEDGAITTDKMDFFVKNLEFGAIANGTAAAQYQVPEGQEAYIKMNATNISFLVAEGETVNVHVVCSKNACKNLEAEEAKDRQCKVNVDGTNYGCEDMLTGTYDITDAEGNVETLPTNEIKFSLGEGIHTFQKFSGTGNILISSIKITPVKGTGINAVNGENKVANNGKFIKNNRVVIVKNGAEFSVTGAQLK